MSSVGTGSRGVLVVIAAVVSWLALGGAATAAAKDKGKAPAAASKPAAPSEPLNACGCYKNGSGACICTDKKASCDCPGDCEPVGCAAKREKELDREMAAEVKRAQQQDAEEKKRKAAEEAAERGEPAAVPDAGVSSDVEDSPPRAKKPAGKVRPKPPKG